MAWDDVLNAKKSIFALDFSNLTPVNDVEAAGLADITSTVNEAGAVLKLDVDSSDQSDVMVRGTETFIQFDDNGLLLTPESIRLEFDWSNTHSVATNTDVLLQLSIAETAIGLTFSGNDFYLNSITQDGSGGSEIDHVLVSGPDRILGSAQADSSHAMNNGGVVQGFDGDDLLFTGDGDNTLCGGTGDDTFYGLSGRDAYIGWLGNDTLDLHHHDAAVKVPLGSYVLSDNGDRASLSGIESFIGTTFDDLIYVGNHPSGVVYGRSGNDRIYSDLYNDVLHGKCPSSNHLRQDWVRFNGGLASSDC